MEPKKPGDEELHRIELLNSSVQQLSAEARELREVLEIVTRGRSIKDTQIMMFLLAVIALSVVGMFLHVVF